MMHYRKDGNLEIDNNLVENSIRPTVIGKNNYIYCVISRVLCPATVVFEGAERIYLQQMAFRAVSEFRELWKGDATAGTFGKAFPEDAWGVYSWFGLDRVSQETTPLIKGTPIIINWRNLERHLTQIDPEETNIAWWQIDITIYGRFARGFDHANGKDSLFFDLDDRFFTGNDREILLEVTYRDSDPGSWKIIYDAADDSLKTAMEVSNTGTGGWVTKSITLKDAHLANRGERGADLILVNTGDTNCRFHMIAIDKIGQTGFPIEETTRATYQDSRWQFPGDTLLAWQYDHIQNASGEMLFALDSSQTIGIYGCNDISGRNVRSYEDAANSMHAAQFNWDDTAETLKKNGQWMEFTAEFSINEPYQLLLRARKDIDASVKLTIYNKRQREDVVVYKDVNLYKDFINLGNDQTDWFISKFALTGLWGSYVVRFDWYDNVGLPGIFGEFSFTESELDITPPAWYYVSVGTISAGTDIIVITTETAEVYLVPSGTEPVKESVIEASVAELEVTAYNQAQLTTTGLMPGEYVFYAIDSSGNISEASPVIVLEKPVNTSLISDNQQIRINYNHSSESITVKCGKDLKVIYIYNILGEKVKSKLCNSNVCDLGISDLHDGVYLVRIFTEDEELIIRKIYKG